MIQPNSGDDILAIIPARGGSKRVPDKNIRDLAGKPLIAYTLESAINSQCFGKIVVSTDDSGISKVAENYGLEVDNRPEYLSGDTIRAVEVIEEYLHRSSSGDEYAHVAMMLPTCPFRIATDVKDAVDAYLDDDGRLPMIGVAAYDFPSQLALKSVGDGSMIMCDQHAYELTTRTQSIETMYHPNGAIYIHRVERFLNSGTFFQELMHTCVMPAERSFDIDYPYQFTIAEQMMRLKNNEDDSL